MTGFRWGECAPEQLETPVRIAIHNEGLFALHNLVCWFCDKRPAVFSLAPDWCFFPCRECQLKYIGAWTLIPKKRAWWQRRGKR